MEVMDKMFRYITSRKDTLVMLWEREKGWQTATEKSYVLKDADLKKINLADFEKWAFKDDAAAFGIFVKQLENAVNGETSSIRPDEEKVAVAVRLLSQSGTYVYQNINCWLERENGRIERIFVMTEELDSEEIHRINISRTFTSDRDPMLVQRQAVELIKANPDKKYAVIQFDIAKFKTIPMEYGEKNASELLDFIIASLKVICNRNQLFTRLSADVFMIITPYESEKWICDFIEMLDKELLGHNGMKYRIVYGVCYVGDLEGGLRQYGDAAALARQSIKGDVLQKIAFYRNDLGKNISASKFIEDNMNRALEDGEFVMYLQPKCRISNGNLVGAEALVRWIMPGKGVIPPNEFVPVFEKNGFIVRMDRYIWEEACKCIRRWMDAGIEPVPISVNVSRKHLHNNYFISVLDSLIEKYQISRKYLEIEITESIDESGIGDSIQKLKDHGFTLLMDDFGSGYSSLNMLKDTQFDVLKIDREFLNDFIGSDRGQKIVEYTIRMTREIGLDMVAEGVETREQADFLERCGCDTAQGFYYSKPVPVEEFEKKYYDANSQSKLLSVN